MKNLTKKRITMVLLTTFLSSCGGSSGDETKLGITSPTDSQMYAMASLTQTTKNFTITLSNSNISEVGVSPSYSVSLTGISSPFSIINNSCHNLSIGQECSFSVKYAPSSNSDYNIAQDLNVTLNSNLNSQIYNATYNIQGKESPEIYIFGDSLSDSGYQNLLQATPGWPNIPDTSTPKLPTFTTPGGKVWGQHLESILGRNVNTNNTNKLPVTLTASGTLSGNNYAAGGATTTCTGITASDSGNIIYSPPPIGPLRTGESCPDPTIQQYNQIDNYLASNSNQANPNAIYILWGGANNIFIAQASTPSEVAQKTISAAKDISHDVYYLYQHGARKFIILNLPNLGLAPSETNNGQIDVNESAQAIATVYNTTLNSELAIIKSNSPDIQYQTIDTFNVLNEIVQNSEIKSLGITYTFNNTKQSACTFSSTTSAISCIPENEKLQGYVFEDGVHPTSEMHKIISNYIYTAIEKLEQ
ncbi:MAG: SGNH/GDSL hydrolase family protein [Proteobacteria bacterium]|nr:SGNH/GDSL hydrolase family protein [Pseudomonadota bacterium]